MRKFRILIVCHEPQGLVLLTSMLKSLGHLIEEAPTDRVAVRFMERTPINLVLASVDPGDAEALELLSYVRRKHPAVPVILMFGRVHSERAKEALRQGAMAVLKFPVPAAELRAAVLQALEQCEVSLTPSVSLLTSGSLRCSPADTLAAPVAARTQVVSPLPASAPGIEPDLDVVNGSPSFLQAPAALSPVATASSGVTALPVVHHPATARGPSGSRAEELAREIDLVTADPGLRQIIELTVTLARSPSSVLFMGEPGTGKSLFAQLLHGGADPAGGPFVILKAAELTGEETDGEENENHVPATNRASALAVWSEKLAQARGGILHIKEVGALPGELQLQLMRQLQLHDIEAAGAFRQGGSPGVRFVLSSSEHLPSLVEQGRFRPELYHRISTLCLMIPPLRHRGNDIELLAEHFRSLYAHEFHKELAGFTRDALEALTRHDWPGNVRELKGVIQRAIARSSGPRISSTHLAPILNYQRQSR
ncbi:MAG: sigma-54-dependent Fis family transcriptional regulator, partial [Planctomycetaceae bacterium]|nr:sigma-54-dependent Fis family transcriptional regulator [Planctomycetaceae bacterium]